MLTFTVARAGMTVFAPSPTNPPRMPWISSVGPRPGSFQNRVAHLAGQRRRTDFLAAIALFVERQFRPSFELGRGRGVDLVAEAGNQHPPGRLTRSALLEARDDLSGGFEGVGSSATVNAGVQIGCRAGDLHLGVDDAPQPNAKGGQSGREHFGVADENGVGREFGAVLLEVGGDGLAAAFLLAFD